MGVDPSGATNLMFKFFVLSLVITLMPESPFEHYITWFSQIPYLSYINWFVPIGPFVAVFEAFLVVISIYYGYLIVIRYINLVKGGD